jgi:hypothetical protein
MMVAKKRKQKNWTPFNFFHYVREKRLGYFITMVVFNKCLFMKNLLFFTLLNKKIAPLCLKFLIIKKNKNG